MTVLAALDRGQHLIGGQTNRAFTDATLESVARDMCQRAGLRSPSCAQ